MAAKLVQQVQFFAFLEEEMNPFLADSKKILGFFSNGPRVGQGQTCSGSESNLCTFYRTVHVLLSWPLARFG